MCVCVCACEGGGGDLLPNSVELVKSSHAHKDVDTEEVVVDWDNDQRVARPNGPSCGQSRGLVDTQLLCRPLHVSQTSYHQTL